MCIEHYSRGKQYNVDVLESDNYEEDFPNQIVLVTYTYLADVAGVVKCLCF